jgi:hypothetical protein
VAAAALPVLVSRARGAITIGALGCSSLRARLRFVTSRSIGAAAATLASAAHNKVMVAKIVLCHVSKHVVAINKRMRGLVLIAVGRWRVRVSGRLRGSSGRSRGIGVAVSICVGSERASATCFAKVGVRSWVAVGSGGTLALGRVQGELGGDGTKVAALSDSATGGADGLHAGGELVHATGGTQSSGEAGVAVMGGAYAGGELGVCARKRLRGLVCPQGAAGATARCAGSRSALTSSAHALPSSLREAIAAGALPSGRGNSSREELCASACLTLSGFLFSALS